MRRRLTMPSRSPVHFFGAPVLKEAAEFLPAAGAGGVCAKPKPDAASHADIPSAATYWNFRFMTLLLREATSRCLCGTTADEYAPTYFTPKSAPPRSRPPLNRRERV